MSMSTGAHYGGPLPLVAIVTPLHRDILSYSTMLCFMLATYEGEGALCVELSRLSLRNKGVRQMLGAASPEWENWVDVASPHAKMVWRSQFPSLLQKCIWYALTPDDIGSHLRSLFRGLGVKGYPPEWWRGTLKKFHQKTWLCKVVSIPELLQWRREGKR